MLKICALCGKNALIGKSVTRKGLAKKKGGTGKKIVRATKREFLPNLQKMTILVDNKPCRVFLCAKCIKKGNFKKV